MYMQRLLIAGCLAVTGVSAVVAFYYWQQATQLPTWYTANQTEVQTEPALPPTVEPPMAEANQSGSDQGNRNDRTPVKRAQAEQTESASAKPTTASQPPAATSNAARSTTKQPATVQQQKTELKRLFTAEVTRKVESKKLGGALKQANTTLQNGKVESGAVVNFENVSLEQLPPEERAFLAKVVAAFPELSRQSFYIGVEGTPTVKNGQAQLSDNMRIKLGKLSFTPAELSQRLGIPEAQIRQQLQLQVQLGNLKVDSLPLADDRPSP